MVRICKTYEQFNSYSYISTISLFETIPLYIVVLVFVLALVTICGLYAVLFYYIYKKHKSFDNYLNKARAVDNQKDNGKEENSYKSSLKSYNMEMSDLCARPLPNKQRIVEVLIKFIEFIRQRRG